MTLAGVELREERLLSRRTWLQMLSLALVFFCLLLLTDRRGALAAAPAMASDPRATLSWGELPSASNPFATIPPGDVIYRDLQLLRDAGVLEPQAQALISVQPPLSRYEVAVCLARILSSVGPVEGKAGGAKSQAEATAEPATAAQVSPPAAGTPSVGVGLPESVVVDEALLDRLFARRPGAAASSVREALVNLLVEFSSELAVMGYRVHLSAGNERSILPSLLAAGSTSTGVGFTLDREESDVSDSSSRAGDGSLVLPAWARSGASRLEWSYHLGESYGKSTGYSLAQAAENAASAAAGANQPGGSPWEGKVLVVVPAAAAAAGRSSALVGLDTSYKLGSIGEARWQWWSPYSLSLASQPVVAPGSVSTLGGEMRLLPGVTVRGELIQTYGSDGTSPTSSSRVATQVVLGDLQLGASARWTQPGFPVAGSEGGNGGGSRSYELEVKGGDVTLTAHLARMNPVGALDLARYEPGRTVRAIGLTYDLNNLAVIRAGYQWIDLGPGKEGNHQQQQGTAELGVGLTANGPGGTSVKADVLWQGTAGEGRGVEVSTTASLEYRLLPWSARFMTDTRLGDGRTTSTSLSLGYSPSDDKSFWIGYKLVEYHPDQDRWLRDQTPENVAQAGLFIRF
ncbi:MAG: hypothetical protein IMX00_10250 [Limnochordales bacterium]|nr:hypothetical protein [Limnochordales bacterium]